MAGLGDGIEDDASIPDHARLLRRVPLGREVPQDGGHRPESSTFEERALDCGLSVTLWEVAGDLAATVAEKPEFGIVRVTAAELRAAGYAIVRVPLPDNPNHCECFGSPTNKGKKVLAKAARWVKVPDGREPAEFGDLDAL